MKVHRVKFINNWNNNLDSPIIPDLRPYDPCKHEIDQVCNITCLFQGKITHHFKARIVYLQRIRLSELSPGVSYITFGRSTELTISLLQSLYISQISEVRNVRWVYIVYEKLQNLIV